MQYDKLQDAFHVAALKAIAATGDAYKSLSWFWRNKPKHPTPSQKENE